MWFTSRQNQGQVIFWTYCEGFWRHVRNCFMSVHSWNSFSVLFHWNGFCILASQCSSAKNIETVVMDSLIMNNLRFYWVSPPNFDISSLFIGCCFRLHFYTCHFFPFISLQVTPLLKKLLLQNYILSDRTA